MVITCGFSNYFSDMATWNLLNNITVLDNFMGDTDETNQQLYTLDGTTIYNADGTKNTDSLNTGIITNMQYPITNLICYFKISYQLSGKPQSCKLTWL